MIAYLVLKYFGFISETIDYHEIKLRFYFGFYLLILTFLFYSENTYSLKMMSYILNALNTCVCDSSPSLSLYSVSVTHTRNIIDDF